MEVRWKSLGAVALVGLVLFVTVRAMMGPQLYPGDRVETRVCRWCNGTGRSDPSEEGIPNPGGPCPGCRGAKKLRVILPGPQHPAVVKGTVRDSAVVGELDSMMPETAAMMQFQESRNPTQPVTGAVPGLRLVFEGNGQKLELNIAKSGRFKALLPPGDYQVTLSAPGYATRSESLHVAARREPIWDERATLITEERIADETWVDFRMTRNGHQ
ncbi:MAG: hypothetical protein AB1758_05075 [Candidatus Eremiobacterota bacterium]